MHYSNPSAHNQGRSHLFQCCSTVQRASAVENWPPEWLSQRKGERKFYSFHRWETEAQGRKGGAGKKGKMWYVQGHPGRLLQSEKMNPHFSLHPPSLLSAYKVSILRAAWEFIWVNAIVYSGYQEKPTSSQVQKGSTQFAALQSVQQRKERCISKHSHPAP